MPRKTKYWSIPKKENGVALLVATSKTLMTPLLEKALSKVYKLPPEEQNAIAAIILEELEDERQWQEVFAESQDKLAQLAHKVRADIKAGHIKKMDIDEL